MKATRFEEKTTTSSAVIENAYIAVELKAQALGRLRQTLADLLGSQGVDCENASPSIHVSIAYGQGQVETEKALEAASEIAKEGFTVRAHRFELLKGLSTPFDYLILSLDASEDFLFAQEAISGCMQVRQFDGGFKSHVSLLRFRQGSLDSELAQNLVRELNASQGAAFALGQRMEFSGECVCVFNPNRECCVKVLCASEKASSSWVT